MCILYDYTVNFLFFLCYNGWSEKVILKDFLNFINIFFDLSLSISRFITALSLDLSDFLLSFLILQVLIYSVDDIEFKAASVLIVLLVDRCLYHRHSCRAKCGSLRRSCRFKFLCKGSFLFPQFFVGLRDVVLPKLFQLFWLPSRSVYVDSHNSVVFFAQERSEASNSAWRAIRCRRAVFKLTAASYVILLQASARMDIPVRRSLCSFGQRLWVVSFLNDWVVGKFVLRSIPVHVAAQFSLRLSRALSMSSGNRLRIELLVESSSWVQGPLIVIEAVDRIEGSIDDLTAAAAACNGLEFTVAHFWMFFQIFKFNCT